jgi:DNA replication protein DnaC
MAKMENCQYKDSCSKYGTERCNQLCYAFVFMHGNEGDGGYWNSTRVPKKYKHCRLNNLPNVSAYNKIENYINDLERFTQAGAGLFLYSVPTDSNPFGTGTGKTTSAVTVLNEFVIMRTKQHLKGEKLIDGDLSVFVKLSDFQNNYNGQFRGNKELQEENSNKYYLFKERMKNCELLVLDDIAIRTGTEAFLNEFYEIIDHRTVEELPTIYTSNLPLNELTEYFGERIVSRITGGVIPIPFTGNDQRLADLKGRLK